MGGTGGTGTTDTTGVGASTTPASALAANPNTFAGSRSAADAAQSAQTPEWLSGLLGGASPAAAATPAASASPLAVNPTAAGTQFGTPAPGAEGFTHAPYPTATDLPHIGAPDKVVAPPVTPAAPAQGPMRQIWPPAGGGTAGDWVKANPNYQAEWDRAEQRADGSWWVPTDPNAPSPGPKYYNGTGDVVYQYSPPHG